MINPITAASIGIVLLFIAITYLIPAAPVSRGNMQALLTARISQMDAGITAGLGRAGRR